MIILLIFFFLRALLLLGGFFGQYLVKRKSGAEIREQMQKHLGNVINDESKRLRFLVEKVLQMSMLVRTGVVPATYSTLEEIKTGCAYGNPDLQIYGILGSSIKGFDVKVLLNPFKVKFHVPSGRGLYRNLLWKCQKISNVPS